jgi:dTDP-4-amino-4,6-dideoxygalactose transaminase
LPKLAVNGGPKLRDKPFPSWPIYDESDAQAVTDVLRSGRWSSIHGDKVRAFGKAFAEFHQARFAVPVNSGTAALEISLRAVGVRPGDEVIVPPYTFVASATSILAVGAIPVFADIDPDTFCLDPKKAEETITDRTKAIMPVHLGGGPADLDSLLALASRHSLAVVEDAAQAHGAEWKGRRVGAIGNAGCFSFYSSKNLNCGEGGAILTDHEEVEKMAWSLHNCGRMRDGAWYSHYVPGGNHRMTEFQAALLLSQLPRLEAQMALREANAAHLRSLLEDVEGITPLLSTPGTTRHAHHLFIFKYDASHFGGAPRDAFIRALNAEGVPCGTGYAPLYREPLFSSARDFHPFPQRLDYSRVDCPATEKACNEEGVWLQHHRLLLGSREDVEDIAAAILKIKANVGELAARAHETGERAG